MEPEDVAEAVVVQLPGPAGRVSAPGRAPTAAARARTCPFLSGKPSTNHSDIVMSSFIMLFPTWIWKKPKEFRRRMAVARSLARDAPHPCGVPGRPRRQPAAPWV